MAWLFGASRLIIGPTPFGPCLAASSGRARMSESKLRKAVTVFNGRAESGAFSKQEPWNK